MKYGFFDDEKKEYVITNPKTPYPWINYLGNEDFFSIISNTAGGYSFFKDARLRRITRYRYNNVPLDNGGKYFYINDNGTIWSPGWKPVKTQLDSYECRHGLGYTSIKSERNKLEAELLYFVPVGYWGEVQRVRITNKDKYPKKVSLYSFVEWCLWNALDDMTNFQRNFSTGEVEIIGSTIYHKTEYRERRNHYAFYTVNCPINGFDSDREAFLGIYNDFDNPDAVVQDKSFNTEAHGWSPIASHRLHFVLNPGETKDFVFILGYVENEQDSKFESPGIINKKKAQEMMIRFNSSEKVDAGIKELRSFWDELLSVYRLKFDDPKLERMVNIWNQYQCMVTFNMSRSASYFESGIGRGMGFRDSNQDLLGFVHQIPHKARERIIDIASTQFEDGGAYHQYQPLTKRGNSDVGGNFNDDPLWLILSTTAYIKETGDFSILDVQVPFDHDRAKAKSLFHHLTVSFDHVINNLGPHDLPLIGRADWNDCLNLNCFSTNPDESFQTTENKSGGKAESVMIAGLFVLCGEEYAMLCDQIGKPGESKRARSHIAKMRNAIIKHGWDGEWFLRAYDYFGTKIGSKENDEGQIFIESQGFCIMAGIGLDDGKAQKALRSVEERLACEYGIVLNNPPFTGYKLNMGEITTYPQGYKENAGVFCHNNPWIMIAETMLGNGEKAWDYFRRICPSYLEEISDLHKTEPYVYAQMIAGKDAFRPGEAKNSWLSGTAAWTFYTISQYILGIKPQYDGLEISPCIPKSWKNYTILRKFRNAEYRISILNPDGVNQGVKSLTINGNPAKGNVVPVQATGTINNIEVMMG